MSPFQTTHDLFRKNMLIEKRLMIVSSHNKQTKDTEIGSKNLTRYTVCPRSLDPFYTVTQYMK